jgi:LAO/AO transport system kinase
VVEVLDPPAPHLLEAARRGDRAALARTLTRLENGGPARDGVVAALDPDDPPAAVVGITGAPGAGKSTLTGALVARIRARGDEVAVLAIDPSSPRTGGAILGDRIRLRGHEADPGVFVRSTAARGHLGGLARSTPAAVSVLEAAGFRWVLVETVGVGQAEVDVAAIADTVVVVVNPGWGDEVQASKAGLLEVADVFAVNKADRPGTDAAVRDLEVMLGRGDPHDWRVPVVRTVALDGRGVDELLRAIDAHREHSNGSGELVRRRRARQRATSRGENSGG